MKLMFFYYLWAITYRVYNRSWYSIKHWFFLGNKFCMLIHDFEMIENIFQKSKNFTHKRIVEGNAPAQMNKSPYMANFWKIISQIWNITTSHPETWLVFAVWLCESLDWILQDFLCRRNNSINSNDRSAMTEKPDHPLKSFFCQKDLELGQTRLYSSMLQIMYRSLKISRRNNLRILV